MVDTQPVQRRIPDGTGRKQAGPVLSRASAKTGGRQMMRTLLAALCCATTFAAIPALAESEGRGVGYAATGPVFDLPAGMSVERQEVHISLHSVRLAYIFKSPAHQTAHFSFAMPEMPVDANPDIAALSENSEAAGLAADTQPPNYLNLSVRVNGKPLAFAGHGHALLDGKDVTRQLLDAGVPLLSGPDGESPWQHLPSQVQTKLEASGLVHGDTAQWNYQADFEWDQTFEPGETRVEISYAPVSEYLSDIGSSVDPGGSATRAYCIDDAVRRAFLRKPSYELYSVTHLAAGGWRGPVGHYRLTVDKGAAVNLVAFCPLEAKNVSPTTFEWTAKNLTPERQLGVLFFVDPDSASSSTQK
ncbi:DUF4424 family protein [Nitrobacter sp. NHB1]|uniref:DUF4424 family protein n=1 Tax=Nitrobacter sp. NHB1 TaxID=3119830 RepID=UPI002FFE5785